MIGCWTFMPLSNRGFVLLDSVDYARFNCFTWHLSKKGYAVCDKKRNGRRLGYLHRLVLALKRGDGLQVDHINRDKLDNRRSNLRVVTHAENRQNVGSARGSSSSFRGVAWDKENKKWLAYATVNGKRKNLGRFSDEIVAAIVSREFRKEHMPMAVESNA